jgi:Domain of unknown function (DUF5666)
MRRTIVLLTGIAVLAVVASAHGNEQHVMGTVARISPTSITVETTSKTSVEVMLAPDTEFAKGTASATLKDLHVGDRVVIHAKLAEGGKLVAHTVQIGVARTTQSHSGNTHLSG